MSRYLRWQNAQRWEGAKSSISLGSATVTRVVTDDPDPGFTPRPTGFTATLRPIEPLLWEGDNA